MKLNAQDCYLPLYTIKTVEIMWHDSWDNVARVYHVYYHLSSTKLRRWNHDHTICCTGCTYHIKEVRHVRRDRLIDRLERNKIN